MNVDEILPLLKKYQGRGPRYTSYPSAAQFSDTFSEADYLEYASASNQHPLPVPLSLYIHVPFCRSLCYYCACNKVVTHNPEAGELYLDYLYKEMAMQGELYADDRFVEQLHIGGGTPTFFPPDKLEEMLQTVAQCFHFGLPKQVELAIEIDPRTVDAESVSKLAKMGFNRFSLGVQDTNPEVQRAINREQSMAQVVDVVHALREHDVKSIAFDLIYGLPLQTQESFVETLMDVLSVRPDRIALFHYAHMPNRVSSQRLIDSQLLPSDEVRLLLFTSAMQILSDAGYVYLGLDHFALPEDPLVAAKNTGELQRNFQGYSTHAHSDIVGLGVSSISHVNGCYSQNSTSVKSYKASLDKGRLPVVKGHRMSADDQVRADLIQSLLCSGEINWLELGARYGVVAENYFEHERLALRPFIDDGLVVAGAEGIKVTENGRYFLRPIATIFDGYLTDTNGGTEGLQQASKPSYSNML